MSPTLFGSVSSDVPRIEGSQAAGGGNASPTSPQCRPLPSQPSPASVSATESVSAAGTAANCRTAAAQPNFFGISQFPCACILHRKFCDRLYKLYGLSLPRDLHGAFTHGLASSLFANPPLPFVASGGQRTRHRFPKPIVPTHSD